MFGGESLNEVALMKYNAANMCGASWLWEYNVTNYNWELCYTAPAHLPGSILKQPPWNHD